MTIDVYSSKDVWRNKVLSFYIRTVWRVAMLENGFIYRNDGVCLSEVIKRKYITDLME